MYQIIRISGGKQTKVTEGGNLAKLKDRLKQLKLSTRGGKGCGRGGKFKVEYKIIPKDTNEN